MAILSTVEQTEEFEPIRTDTLHDDVEGSLDQVDLGSNGNGETSFGELLEEYQVIRPQRGDLLKGHILTINKDGILVDVGAKRDAFVPADDLKKLDEKFQESLSIGDEVPVYVLRPSNKSDELQVSIRRGLEALDWERAEEYLESGELLDLEIIGYNKGGLLVLFGHIHGFVPNSHIPELRHIRSPQKRDDRKVEMVGESLPLKVIELNRGRRRLVLSAKAAAREREEQRLEEIEPGQVLWGTVESIANFGAFVNLGGVTGLVHISKLAWQRVEHPSEVVSVGDRIQVKIDDIDYKRNRIRLNRQATLPDPWDIISDEYAVGDVVEGTVVNVVDYGVFVQLPIGVDGLVHVSEIPDAMEQTMEESLAPGTKVNVRIIGIEPEDQRVRLSLLETGQPEPAALDWDIVPSEDSEQEEDERAAAELEDVQTAESTDELQDELQAVAEEEDETEVTPLSTA